MRRVPFRLPASVAGSALSVLALAAGLAVMPGPASAGPFDGFFPSGGPFGPGRSVVRTARLSSPQIVDILYSRYGVARIILVRPLSVVYEVDAIDRRGQRVRYTVDAFDGQLLERAMLGAYEAPVPLPPGSIPMARAPRPGAPLYGEPPSAELYDPGIAPRTYPRAPAQPSRERQVRRPDGFDAPEGRPFRRPVRKADPATSAPSAALPTGPTVVPVERKPLDPPASTAARAPAEAPAEKPAAVKPPPAQAPAAAAPPALRPASPAPAQPREVGSVKQAAPSAATRIPEPLIDPKTGKPTGASPSVPVAPLDDVKRPSGDNAHGAARPPRLKLIRKRDAFSGVPRRSGSNRRVVTRPSAGRRPAGWRCSRSPSPARRR